MKTFIQHAYLPCGHGNDTWVVSTICDCYSHGLRNEWYLSARASGKNGAQQKLLRLWECLMSVRQHE
jgi:hypothetical protein